MSTRYAVARYCFAGIGDHLLCLIGAWWVARRTGRTLVVDWRGSRFNSDPAGGRNCFFDYFEPVERLGDVRLIADDRVGAIDYPLPIWPDKWNPATLASLDHLKHTAEEFAAVNRLVQSNEDAPQPTVVLNQFIDPAPPRAAIRAMLADLRPAQSIREEAQRFWDRHVGSAPAIAIHLRHGNGENVGDRAAYWLGAGSLVRQLLMNSRNDIHRAGLTGRFSDNMPTSLVGSPEQARAERRFCRRVAARFHALARSAGFANAVPILFCDSAQIVRTMSEVLPTTVVLPKRLMGRGGGPLHQFDAESVRHTAHGVRAGNVADRITREMFIELELMQRCAGLLYMDSGFSILSRIRLDDQRIFRLQPSLLNRNITRIVRRLTSH
jgi:hypothetical protein